MNAGAREYCCTVCGRIDNWGKGWAWYGSLKDEDELSSDELRKRVVCSDKCRALKPVHLADLKELKSAKARKVYHGPTVPDA